MKVSTLCALILILAAAIITGCSNDVAAPDTTTAQAPGSILASASRDTDGDGLIDAVDTDDDNDGIPDDMDDDDDGDGIADDDENDADGDGVIDDEDDDHFEIKGTIDAIDGTTLTVHIWTVLTDENTRIEGEGHQDLTFDDLAVGMKVEVYATLQEDDTYLAHKIEVEDESDDGDDDHVAPSELAVGDWVKVEATETETGWLATKFEREHLEDGYRYEGFVGSVGEGTFDLLGVTFIFTPVTRFHDTSEADLATGDYVDVHAVVSESGYLAKSVRERTGRDRIRVHAQVEQIDLESGIITVGGVSFETQ